MKAIKITAGEYELTHGENTYSIQKNIGDWGWFLYVNEESLGLFDTKKEAMQCIECRINNNVDIEEVMEMNKVEYDFDELMNMSNADTRKTGKSKAEWFLEQGKDCELNFLAEAVSEYYQEVWSPARSILMFGDGSALQLQTGQFTII